MKALRVFDWKRITMNPESKNPESKNFESRKVTPNEGVWANWQNEKAAGDASDLIPMASAASAGARPAIAPDPFFTGAPHAASIESGANVKEKRSNPRFKCEGSMELKTEGSTIHTWATFTDVSLSGCYVEIMTTFPVGTVMDLRLGMHGFMVETRAVVRVTYPFLGMGIEFTDIAPNDRKRLDKMLASLAGAFTQRLQMPEPKSLQLPPITEPRAVIEALAKFFGEKSTLNSDEFIRMVQDSQQQSM